MRPTIGRIVHYHPADSSAKSTPYPAIITHVWSETCVNLFVFPDGSFPAGIEPEVAPNVQTSVQEKTDDQLTGVWEWPPRA